MWRRRSRAFPGGVGTDEHGEVVEVEHSDRVSVGVQHVVVGDLVSAGGTHDHRIHDCQLTLIRPWCGGPEDVPSHRQEHHDDQHRVHQPVRRPTRGWARRGRPRSPPSGRSPGDRWLSGRVLGPTREQRCATTEAEDRSTGTPPTSSPPSSPEPADDHRRRSGPTIDVTPSSRFPDRSGPHCRASICVPPIQRQVAPGRAPLAPGWVLVPVSEWCRAVSVRLWFCAGGTGSERHDLRHVARHSVGDPDGT